MNDDQYHEGVVDAIYCARAESLKAFLQRVACLGHDPNAPAYSLSWARLAEFVFDFLCQQGINPLKIEQSLLGNVLENVADGLSEQGWQEELTINSLMEIELPGIPLTEPDPDEEEGDDEGYPEQPEDAHLEAAYEDRYDADQFECPDMDIYGGQYSEM